MNWLPFPTSFLKYIAFILLAIGTYFYGHHTGFKEANAEFQAKINADLLEQLAKQKDMQAKNQELQTALIQLQSQKKQLISRMQSDIQSQETKKILNNPSCNLTDLQVQKLNNILKR